MAERSDRWRSSTLDPPDRRRNLSDNPRSMPSSPREGRRAAASSMARALPSSRRQISPIRPGLSAASSPAPACRARSTKSATASPVGASPDGSSVDGSAGGVPPVGGPSSAGSTPGPMASGPAGSPAQWEGSDSPGTGNTHSNGSISRACEVARIATSGQRPSTRSTKTATASARCSQLSRTSSASRPARWSITASSPDRPCESPRPSVLATAVPTSSPSVTGTRSTNQTPSRRSAARPAATAAARRVLPTPPGPVAVTSRLSCSAAVSAATSAARPTNDVSGTGTARPAPAAPCPPPAAVSGGVSARSWTKRASARRSGTSSLRSSDETWLSTVRTDTKRRAAISAFVARSATRASTSASRSDTPASIRVSAGPTTTRFCRGGPPNRARVPVAGVAIRGGSVVDPWCFRAAPRWQKPSSDP